MLATGLLVVHDTGRGSQDHVAELTRGQETDSPLLEIGQLNVVAGRDDASLVEAAKALVIEVEGRQEYIPANKLDDNLAGTVVIDLLELANVACDELSAVVAKN